MTTAFIAGSPQIIRLPAEVKHPIDTVIGMGFEIRVDATGTAAP